VFGGKKFFGVKATFPLVAEVPPNVCIREIQGVRFCTPSVIPKRNLFTRRFGVWGPLVEKAGWAR